MSMAQIEAELKRMSATELRQLALCSWAAFVEKEELEPQVNECDERDPELLAALDEAVRRANLSDQRLVTGEEVRSRVQGWSTK